MRSVARGLYDGGIIAADRPTLIAAAHGTRSDAGQAVISNLVNAVRARRPALDVRLAYVDVVEPFLADVVAEVSGPLVVVPVLLSRGYHVRVDIPSALGSREDACASTSLGPHRAVSVAMAERLADARGPGVLPAPGLVLVATGSSDPDSAQDLQSAAADLAELLERPVHAGVMSGPGQDFAALIDQLGPDQVDVVPYLLADGFFLDRLVTQCEQLGVRTTGGPIGAHPAVVELILNRYDRALDAVAESDEVDGR